MKLCWLTDIHLNFLSEPARKEFYTQILKANADAVVISGDIADAPTLDDLLMEMASFISKPIYFVLGNHDYYHSEVSEVRDQISLLCKNNRWLHWVPLESNFKLSDKTILIGQDGWADGRYGDYQNSPVVLNDSRLIYNLFSARLLGHDHLLRKMQELSDIDAKSLEVQLADSINKSIKKIIILTHVPPFDGACWHEGENSDKNWMPFFTSKAIGDVIFKNAKKNPKIEFLVLCGHTHSKGIYKPLKNLLVKTGRAEYYLPEIQEIIKQNGKNLRSENNANAFI